MIRTKTRSATPILDLIAPLPKPGSSKFPPGHLAVPILLVASALATRNAEVVIPLFGLWVIMLFVTTVHELGHVFAGRSVGFAFKSVAIGPIVIKRENSRLRVGLRKALFGGLTYMSLDRFYRVRKRLLVYITAGPAVGFVLAAVAIACFRAAVDGDHARASILFGALAGSSLLSSIAALFPNHSGPFPNDGMQLKVLLRSKDGTKRVLASYGLDLHRRKSTDQLSLNPRWARLAVSPSKLVDSRFSKYLDAWAAYRNAASEEKGAEFLESCLAMSAFLSEDNLDILILEAAVFTARVGHDSEKADTWFKRVVNLPRIPSLTRLRAQATLSYEAGRFDDAVRQVELGLAFIRHAPANGVLDGQEAAWLKWRGEIESRRDEQAVPA